MDFRSQDEDIGMPSSLGYNNPPPIRGSAFSKPSTSPSSSSSLLSPRGVAPGHRNGSAFGNTQPPPPAPPLNPRIDPDPSRSLGKNPDPAAIPTASPSSSSGKTLAPAVESAALYCECLRNHAASIGGHVVDGCGEFMPFGDAGTPDALKCAACGCHRSFHRKDVGGDPSAGSPYYRGAPRLPLLLPPPHPRAHHHKRPYPMGFPPSPSQAAPGSYSAAMAFGGNASGSGGTTTESSSEERMTAGEPPPVVVLKKRFRTKFTAEQKERMLAFAESVGWRFHKQDEALVQQFCAEVGVRRQVLKVWMHNNKHTFRRQQQQQQQQQQQEQEQQHPPQHQQQL